MLPRPIVRPALAALLCAIMLFSGPAGAVGDPSPAGSAWVETPEGRIRLISPVIAVGTETPLTLAVEFDQKPGWKIYWRNPGDAGLPPDFSWSGSVNVAALTPLWPVPERFSFADMETLGYAGRVALPLRLEPEVAGRAVDLRLSIDYLTCDDRLCVPRSVALTLDLPAGEAAPSAFAQTVARAVSAVPEQGTSHGLEIEEAVIEPEGVVRVRVRSLMPMDQPDLFLDAPSGLAFEAPVVALNAEATAAVLRARRYGGLTLEGVTLTALVVDGSRGVETPVATEGEVRPGLPPGFAVRSAPGSGAGAIVGATVGTGGLAAMIGIALIGGLILNLMPCVLPVLSLKLLGVINQAGLPRAVARRSFLATSTGIVFSFLVLAVLAIGLKAAGSLAGWGIHFQQPVFLAAMAALMVMFAANLWGLFEIPLPSRLAALGAGQGGGGGTARGFRSLGGAFATGAFATLLATPCSAPFLGTAVGFALSTGPLETLVIFTALGVGMAAPYLVISIAPGLVRVLPRPGPWMVYLKIGLGCLLAATAVWLGLVLAVQIGWAAALAVMALIAAAPMVLALGRLLGPARVFFAVAALMCALAAVVITALGPRPGADGDGAVTSTGAWRAWSPEVLESLRDRGDVVLVDVTAEWCVTCRVNKAAVLDRGAVETAVNSGRVRALRADWTRPDPHIAAYLASFGRYGIPFNVVYGPGAPDGVVLPELLTEKAVMDAIERAEGRPGRVP